MGQIIFDGKNRVFLDLQSQLPLGKTYQVDNNVIPAVNEVVFIEQFPVNYIIGTQVQIFINDTYMVTKQILQNNNIYYKFTPPYDKFQLKTKINGQIYRDQEFIATDVFMFLNILALTYNNDYVAISQMFGNLFNQYLQDDWLYNKVGWYFNFPLPDGWNIADYRRIIEGTFDSNGNAITTPIIWDFMNAMTYWALNNLVISFTGIAPLIQTYRDVDGW